MQITKEELVAKAKLAAGELGRAGLGWGKAQLIMLGVNFVIITAGMLVAGMHFWSPLIAVAVAVLDLLPVVGSGVVFVPWAVLSFVAGNTRMALVVGLTYIAMVVSRMVLDPIVTGRNIGVSPWITLLSSVLGLFVFGGAGLIIGPLIAAAASVLYRLFWKRQPSGAQTAPKPGTPAALAEPPKKEEAQPNE